MRSMAWLVLMCGVVGCAEESVAPDSEPPKSPLDYAAPAPTAPTPKPAPPVVVQEKAVAGVGAKGRGYGGGIITEPIHQYFLAEQRIAFEIAIPQAMNLYKAQHDFKGPASHEIFMKEIIEFNQIKLPELPEGHSYKYDPKTEELLVEHPEEKTE